MSRRARTALMAVMLAAWAVIPGATTLAATTVVNGVIVSDEQLTLSPDAVAVVTLVDQTATEDSPFLYQFAAGSFTDPWGHIWHIASHVEDVSEEEMARRAREMMSS